MAPEFEEIRLRVDLLKTEEAAPDGGDTLFHALQGRARAGIGRLWIVQLQRAPIQRAVALEGQGVAAHQDSSWQGSRQELLEFAANFAFRLVPVVRAADRDADHQPPFKGML